MKEELRCEHCGWHLVDLEYSDSTDQEFSVEKKCPKCKTRTAKLIRNKV